jgi:phasin family protein
MTSEFFKDISDKTKENFEPVVKLNELMTSSVQDMFKAQMAAVQRYSQLTMTQVKAASEIRDLDSVQSFLQSQVDTFESFNEQVMSDLNAVAEAGNQFRADIEAILNPQTVEETEDKPAKKAPAKATKTA